MPKATDDRLKFRNVGLLLEDHEKLRAIADRQQRSMARQLSVMIRNAAEAEEAVSDAPHQ